MRPAISRTRAESCSADLRNGSSRSFSRLFLPLSNTPLQVTLLALLTLCAPCWCQTASTGALTGEVLDPAGRRIARAAIEAKNQEMAVDRSTFSDNDGLFVLPLLPPGQYQIVVTKSGYSQPEPASVQVPLTESVRIVIPMKIAGVSVQIDVQANISPLQVDSIALGRVVDARAIQALPLAARNFTQIVNLSPGVSTGVNNAGELGTGGGGLAQIDPGNDGIFVHGLRSYDNSYEFDGVPVTDLQASGIASGGIPIPNPDAIEEFKVQTGLYDVSFGEHAGANVSLVTKSGTNKLNGSVFEFFRNNVLNANDYFLKSAGQPRPDLRQNQFGFTLGGPVRRNRLYYFGSYQGTRQTNGLAAGQARLACSAAVAHGLVLPAEPLPVPRHHLLAPASLLVVRLLRPQPDQPVQRLERFGVLPGDRFPEEGVGGDLQAGEQVRPLCRLEGWPEVLRVCVTGGASRGGIPVQSDARKARGAQYGLSPQVPAGGAERNQVCSGQRSPAPTVANLIRRRDPDRVTVPVPTGNSRRRTVGSGATELVARRVTRSWSAQASAISTARPD